MADFGCSPRWPLSPRILRGETEKGREKFSHPEGNPGANLKSISHKYRPILVACVCELTKETINLPLGCLQGGAGAPSPLPPLPLSRRSPFLLWHAGPRSFVRTPVRRRLSDTAHSRLVLAAREMWSCRMCRSGRGCEQAVAEEYLLWIIWPQQRH